MIEPGRGAAARPCAIEEQLTPAVEAHQLHEDGLSDGSLQRLLAWLSPAFPVGGFSYSHGLEWAIEDGTVTDRPSLEARLSDILAHGAGRNDGIIFAHAYRAAAGGDIAGLVDVAELAAAFQPSRERLLESTAQGRAFLIAVTAAWPNVRLARLSALFPPAAPLAYPVAVALAIAAHDVPLRPGLVAYLQAFSAAIVSAGVRAIPMGQTDGQRIITSLAPHIEKIAGIAFEARLDALGGAALRADIASMKHESQYTRLFRS